MPYYFIRCMATKGPSRKLAGGSPVKGLKAGAFAKGKKIESEVPEPVHFQLRSHIEGDMPEFFMTPAFVMQKSFADALRELGVNNIDFYEAVVHDQQTGETWDYVLGNVIGVLDVIDLEKSTIAPESPPHTAMLFDKIVIDETKTQGMQMFRLKHKVSSILVSQEVRDHLEAKGVFKHIEFIEPEDYA